MFRVHAAAALGAALLFGVPAAAAPSTYAVTDRIAGPDGGWDLAAVDAGAQRLYVARATGVTAVDLRTRAVTPSLVALAGGHGVLPIPGSPLVLASNGRADTAVLFDGATGAITATLPVGRKPDAIAWDPVTRTAWVMVPGAGDISVVDPYTAKVVATVHVGGSLELGAADGRGRMYVNIEDRNEVAVLDTQARKLVSRFPLAGCDGPTGIAYDAHDAQVLSACANGVAKVSAVNGREVASLAIGPKPDGAVYDEVRGVALVPSGGSGALAVIRLGAKPAVLQTLLTARGARTIAFDPTTGQAYLPSAQYGAAPAGGGRPPMTPGSFAVLAVSPGGAP